MLKKVWNQVPLQVVLFLFYIFSVIIYLFKLKALNEVLLMNYSQDSPFKIIGYNNNQPLWYVFGAFLFYLIGIGLMIYFVRSMFKVVLEGTVFLIISVILIIVCLVLIFVFINNPILKAFLAVLGIGGVVLGTQSTHS